MPSDARPARDSPGLSESPPVCAPDDSRNMLWLLTQLSAEPVYSSHRARLGPVRIRAGRGVNQSAGRRRPQESCGVADPAEMNHE